jgi:hypothetical protein
MNEVPWPWPLAPLILALIGVAAIAVIFLVQVYIVEARTAVSEITSLSNKVSGREGLPIFPGFIGEILPILIVLWLGFVAAYLISRQPVWWAVIPWATVTTLMLWPVGATLDRSYFSYRNPLFLFGVLSMAYIIGAGWALTSSISFMAKSWIFWNLVVDLTIFAIIPSLPRAMTKPIGMFFRPDLLFGDGRVLCCGTVALVIGIRYMLGTPAMSGGNWPVPLWNWYAIMLAVTTGFIPLIALRGILKLLMRLRRLRDDAWSGWGSIVIRDGLLVVTLLAIGYGFHNAFLGRQPFTWTFLNIPAFWEALAIMATGAFFLVAIRGAYKKYIGEPFFKETLGQTWVKEILYVVGALILFYGLMSLLHTDIVAFRAGQAHLRTLALAYDHPTQFWIGFAFFIWGLVILLPVRVMAQYYQRQAIVSQMAAIIIPSLPESQRRVVLARLLAALCGMSASQRRTYLLAMNWGLAKAPDAHRAVMTNSMVALLSDLKSDQQNLMLEGMVASLARLSQFDRATRMADMLAALTALPDEKRGLMVEKMAPLLM